MLCQYTLWPNYHDNKYSINKYSVIKNKHGHTGKAYPLLQKRCGGSRQVECWMERNDRAAVHVPNKMDGEKVEDQ